MTTLQTEDAMTDDDPCCGVQNGCDCDDCLLAWRIVVSEWWNEVEELPYAN